MKSKRSLTKTTITAPDLQNKVAYWIKIALDDLGSSRTLYEARHYRTSYFLFQQAAEKANKAFALYANLVTEEEFSKIGHDQFKLYRKELVKQECEFKIMLNEYGHCRQLPGIMRLWGLMQWRLYKARNWR